MIQVCHFCGESYEQEAPLESRERKHGECTLCAFLFDIWFYHWRAGMMKERASDFIRKCREILRPDWKELKFPWRQGGQK
ncbi:MAG: hypothetical protein ACLQGU_04275 [bacterium]